MTINHGSQNSPALREHPLLQCAGHTPSNLTDPHKRPQVSLWRSCLHVLYCHHLSSGLSPAHTAGVLKWRSHLLLVSPHHVISSTHTKTYLCFLSVCGKTESSLSRGVPVLFTTTSQASELGAHLRWPLRRRLLREPARTWKFLNTVSEAPEP